MAERDGAPGPAVELVAHELVAKATARRMSLKRRGSRGGASVASATPAEPRLEPRAPHPIARRMSLKRRGSRGGASVASATPAEPRLEPRARGGGGGEGRRRSATSRGKRYPGWASVVLAFGHASSSACPPRLDHAGSGPFARFRAGGVSQRTFADHRQAGEGSSAGDWPGDHPSPSARAVTSDKRPSTSPATHEGRHRPWDQCSHPWCPSATEMGQGVQCHLGQPRWPRTRPRLRVRAARAPS